MVFLAAGSVGLVIIEIPNIYDPHTVLIKLIALNYQTILEY